MGGGFQEKPVNMLGDAGCARRFQRRAIFALGLCCTMGLMSPLARAESARNGGRSVAQLADHFARERLVLWAWSPGVNQAGATRSPPPLSHDQFMTVVRRWISSGAVCPE
jgi:hypothetical protein